MSTPLTPGPAKKSDHVPPAGRITRVLPWAMISTFFTCSGRATAFGRRTAWVLLDLKTVDWLMEDVYTYWIYTSSWQ